MAFQSPHAVTSLEGSLAGERVGERRSMSGPPPSVNALFAEQLLQEMEKITSNHSSQINECLTRWLQTVQESHPLFSQSVMRPSMNGAQSPSTHCDPPLVSAEVPRREEASGDVMPEDSLLCNGATSRTCMPSKSKSGLNKLVSQVATRKAKRVKTKRKVCSEVFATGLGATGAPPTWLQRITASRYYEWASGTLISLNALFIGWQTQHLAVYAADNAAKHIPLDDTTPASFLALQIIFCLLFLIELGLRWVCEGLLGFFQDTDRWWNVLDVVVVSVGVLDLVIHFAMDGSDLVGSISILRVTRVVRIVRVAKVIRIMRFFRELRMMIFSILGSMKSLLWVILVLAMTFYIFGITFTVGTTTALDTGAKWRDASNADLRAYFGSVDRSVLSLFMAMSGGNDWSVYYDVLQVLPIQYRLLFLLFISFAIFAVVNIVTGVFVESAMQSNSKDRDIIVHEELEAKKTYLKSMREIFDEMDDDDTGSISLEEFEAKLDDERVIAYFNAMKLDISDARMLFWLLDYDHSNEVNIDEFLTGCYKLQGESRSLDMKVMQCEVRFLRESFVLFSETLNTVQRGVSDLQSKSHGLVLGMGKH